jgi:predicted GNAT family acetyltransferase
MKWLDKYNNGGVQPNYNDANVSLPPNFKGYGYNKSGNSKNGSWDGPVTRMGGMLPGATGMMYSNNFQVNEKKPNTKKYQEGGVERKLPLTPLYSPVTNNSNSFDFGDPNTRSFKTNIPDEKYNQRKTQSVLEKTFGKDFHILNYLPNQNLQSESDKYPLQTFIRSHLGLSNEPEILLPLIKEVQDIRGQYLKADPFGPAGPENSKVDFEKAVKDKGARQFLERYNDPVTRKRLKEQAGMTDYDIDNFILRGLTAKKTVTNNFRYDAGAMYDGDKHEILIRPYSNNALETHERVHASALDNVMGKVLSKIVGNAFLQKESNNFTEIKDYLNRPHETYGNFSEFRERLGLKPGEQINIKELERRVKKLGLERDHFYDTYDKDKVLKALNTIALNDNLPIQNIAQRGKTIPFKDPDHPFTDKTLFEQYSPILEKTGIDNDLLLRQAWKESSFRPNVKNKLGYMGLAQVGNPVIEDYKKANKVNNVNPYNPSDAKKIQEWYMNNLYNSSFANKSNQSEEVRKAKALAAYNYGRRKVVDSLNSAKSEGMDIYNSLDWLKKLPKETRDYTNKILGKDKDFNKEYDSVSKLPKYQDIINTYNPYPVKLQDGDTVSKEDERRILDYIQLMNMQTKPKGSIRASDTKQTKLSKVKEVALNPLTAMSYIAQNKDIPDNFSRGPRNTLDYALDVINPAQYVEDSKNVVQGSYEGNLGQVGEGLLGVVPMMLEAKNIVKGVDRLGNKPIEVPKQNNAQSSFIKQDLSEGNNIKYSFTDKQGNNIGTFSGRKNPEGIYVNSIEINPELRRQGLASKIYKDIAKDLQSKNEGTLFSRSTQHQFTDKDKLGRSIAPANKLWENLVNKGEAEKFVEGMSHTYKIKPLKEGGVIKDDLGQWAHPGEITEIGSNQITMQGVPYPVLGISDTGDMQMMYPEEEYEFDGEKVTEFPMAKNGIRQEQKSLVNLDQLTNFTNYNTPQPGGWLDKY